MWSHIKEELWGQLGLTRPGEGPEPLVLLQHFRGNLDNWDPALIDTLASTRRVVTFDNAGVGGSTGTTPDSTGQMARDAIAFYTAIGFGRADILGFSVGSLVAREIALIRPDLVRRLILASSAPGGAAGMHGWAPEVIGAVGAPETSPEGYLEVFFAQTPSSRQAGQEVLRRIYARTEDRDKPATWATREAQYDAVCAWGIPDHSLVQWMSGIGQPLLVANGDSDPMILPRYSYLIAGLIPQATVKIYPDSADGFLFQHHAEFAADVEAFLAKPDQRGSGPRTIADRSWLHAYVPRAPHDDDGLAGLRSHVGAGQVEVGVASARGTAVGSWTPCRLMSSRNAGLVRVRLALG